MARFGKYALTTFKSMSRIMKNNPEFHRIVFDIFKNQRTALKRREHWKKQGLTVPPFMIFSITNRCNLNCKGCYHQAKKQTDEKEIDNRKIESIIYEAQELGIAYIILAGGEPLAKPGILSVTKKYQEMLFLLFTNGTLLKDKKISELKGQTNVIPIISIEGSKKHTDSRRGEGVFEQSMSLMSLLKASGIPFGISITVTKNNFKDVTSETFIKQIIGVGSSLIFFADFVPIDKKDKTLMPSSEQRVALNDLVKTWRDNYSAVFISMSEEDEFGGCLSAGTGFIHINPQGDVEPCPMSPVSDVNLKDVSLKEALKSNLLRKIRQNRQLLNESKGGCALYDKSEWLKSLLSK